MFCLCAECHNDKIILSNGVSGGTCTVVRKELRVYSLKTACSLVLNQFHIYISLGLIKV